MEVQGHQSAIDKVVASGDTLVKARHFASPEIKEKQSELKEAWNTLLGLSSDRRKMLDISLAKQKV